MTVAIQIGAGWSGYIGFAVVILLVLAGVLLLRSMNRHMKRVPDSFDGVPGRVPGDAGRVSPRSGEPDGPVDPAE